MSGNSAANFALTGHVYFMALLFLCSATKVRCMADFGIVNTVYGQVFGLNPPTRVCVEAPILERVVVDCIAYSRPHDMMHMHVQSISKWAPANIGPYSQSVDVARQLLFLAGQIGLQPLTMQMALPEMEVRRGLQSVASVLSARGFEPAALVVGTCFVTDMALAEEAAHACREFCPVMVPLAVVQVPRLPRGARFEWHFVAAQGSCLKRDENTCVEVRHGWCWGVRRYDTLPPVDAFLSELVNSLWPAGGAMLLSVQAYFNAWEVVPVEAQAWRHALAGAPVTLLPHLGGSALVVQAWACFPSAATLDDEDEVYE